MTPDKWEPAALVFGFGAAVVFQRLTSRSQKVALSERTREVAAMVLALGVPSLIRHLFPNSANGEMPDACVICSSTLCSRSTS